MSFANAQIIAVGADDEEYHKPQNFMRGDPLFTMSCSALREFANCPSRWKAGYESPQSDAKDDGSLVDCLLLTPGKFKDRYAVRPETYSWIGFKCPSCVSITDSHKCAKCKTERIAERFESPWNGASKECKEWLAKAGDKKVTTMPAFEEAMTAIKRLKEDEIIASWLDCCDNQVWIEADWQDVPTGLTVKFKSLIDFVPNPAKFTMVDFSGSLGDLKRTRNAGATAWARWCFHAGYHIQGACYTDVFNATLKENERPRETFHFILSENYKPWEPGKRILSQEGMDLGRASYRKMLGDYCKCLKSRKWPSYDDIDESIGGWGLVVPSPWMATEGQMAPQYEFDDPEEKPIPFASQEPT